MINTNLNLLSQHVHAYVKSKGFWEKPRTITELLALVHGEVSEAVEEVRKGHAPDKTYYSGKADMDDPIGDITYAEKITCDFETVIETEHNSIIVNKPEGVPSELIDIIFRVCDIAGYYEIDLDAMAKEKMAFNETRPMMHGGKKL